MKKWHWGGFLGCLIGGVVVLLVVDFFVSAFGYYILSSPFTSEEALMIGALVFLLIAVAGLLTGLVCQRACIEELEVRIRKQEERLKEKAEEE